MHASIGCMRLPNAVHWVESHLWGRGNVLKKQPGSVAAPGLHFAAFLSCCGGTAYRPPFVTVTRNRSRYFACIALISATLPARWQSVHCSDLVTVIVVVLPTPAADGIGRGVVVPSEETLENRFNSVPPFDCMCWMAKLVSSQPKQEEAIGELTRLSVL